MAQEPINIEKQFENYLTRVGLQKYQMSEVQYNETKKAFYAGASAMLVLFRGEIPDLSEVQAMAAMEKLWQEAEFFWNKFLVNNISN